MLKFIRRLFILLILFTIAFLAYRYINPDGASRLVDKIKQVPNTISSYFVWEEDDNIKIDGQTTSISWDLYIIEDSNIDNSWENYEYTWLEELNQEIESILWIDKQDENIVVESVLVKTGDVLLEEENKIIDQKPIPEDKSIVEYKTVPTVNNKPVTPSKSNNKLTDYDNDQTKNVFGNLIK